MVLKTYNIPSGPPKFTKRTTEAERVVVGVEARREKGGRGLGNPSELSVELDSSCDVGGA